jgi:tRNA U38,U39,U40 pseudouridine synthase TruA
MPNADVHDGGNLPWQEYSSPNRTSLCGWLLLLQAAAAYLVGEHDFRNFCKADVAQVTDSCHRSHSYSYT